MESIKDKKWLKTNSRAHEVTTVLFDAVDVKFSFYAPAGFRGPPLGVGILGVKLQWEGE